MKALTLFVLSLLAAAVYAVECDVLEDRALTKVYYGNPPFDFKKPEYNDDNWKTTTFPLGACGNCDAFNNEFLRTFVGTDSIATTRTEIFLNEDPWRAHINIRVGNKAWAYVNEEWIGDITNNGCVNDLEEFPWRRVDFDAGLLRRGRNVIVVKAMAPMMPFLDLDVVVEGNTCDGIAKKVCSLIENEETKVLYVTNENPRPDNWGELDLDESNFVMGRFPFGDRTSECENLACKALGGNFPLNSVIVTRSKFFLRKIPEDLKIRVIANGAAWIAVNGNFIGDHSWRSCSVTQDGELFVVNPSVLREGINVIAVTGRDQGGSSYLELNAVARDNECVLGEFATPTATPTPTPTLTPTPSPTPAATPTTAAPTPIPTPVPQPCTDIFAASRCRRLRDEGKCLRPSVLKNCQNTCNPACVTPLPEPTPTPVPCVNLLADSRCKALEDEGKCGRAYVLKNCQENCNRDCATPTPTPLPCRNVLTESRCERLKAEGKCERNSVWASCQLTCNPTCVCVNNFSDLRCGKLRDEGKCGNANVLSNCQKNCNPVCVNTEPDACNGQCRRNEACVVKNRVPYCLDCEIFIRVGENGKEHCCAANAEQNACVKVESLNKACVRKENIMLHLFNPVNADFLKDIGQFCGSFADFERNGAVFQIEKK